MTKLDTKLGSYINVMTQIPRPQTDRFGAIRNAPLHREGVQRSYEDAAETYDTRAATFLTNSKPQAHLKSMNFTYSETFYIGHTGVTLFPGSFPVLRRIVQNQPSRVEKANSMQKTGTCHRLKP